MALFQSSVIIKHLQNQHKENLALKWENFKNHFHDPKVQEDIKSLKEEQYQGEFLEDFFVKILGYTKPASSSETKFNLTTEYKNIKDSKKAAGAIIVNYVYNNHFSNKISGSVNSFNSLIHFFSRMESPY